MTKHNLTIPCIDGSAQVCLRINARKDMILMYDPDEKRMRLTTVEYDPEGKHAEVVDDVYE
jgi:hypothetical protein